MNAGGKIKRILVSADIEEKLANGKLGLAAYKGDIVLIPAETVEKILKRDQDLILSCNDPSEIDDEYPTDW